MLSPPHGRRSLRARAVRTESAWGGLGTAHTAVLSGCGPLTAHLRLLEPVLPREVRRVLRPAQPGAFFSLRLGSPTAAPAGRPLSGEAYRLWVTPEGLSAEAASAEGLYRACATIRRRLERHEAFSCGLTETAPAYPVRGVMLDVSRNRVWSLPTLFGIVDRMARLRLNRLELYFENTFAYATHPDVWADGSPYTPNDLRALDAYCAERFVTLVPNQNTLGHFERWFRLPAYRERFAECPEGGVRTPWGSIQQTPTGIAAGLPEAQAFAAGLLDELLPCFPRATVANLGGDEVFDLGQGRSRTDDPAGLYLAYMARMADVARRHGKRPELWADMLLRHPDALARAAESLPDATWVLWGYEASDPLAANAERLRAAGVRFMVAPGTSSWRSFCGRTTNMLANLRTAATIPCEGMLLTDWGDAGHWQPLAVSLPALVRAADLAWSPDAPEEGLSSEIDQLEGVKGLGALLLRLGDTYRTAQAESYNATRLFQAYNLPPKEAPAFDRSALLAARSELETLAEDATCLGDALVAREARFALGMQRLAIERALGTSGLTRARARLAAQMELLWLERGPRAYLDDSLAAFLAPSL